MKYFDCDRKTIEHCFNDLLHYGNVIEYSDTITTDEVTGFNHFFRYYQFSYLGKIWEVIKKDGKVVELSVII